MVDKHPAENEGGFERTEKIVALELLRSCGMISGVGFGTSLAYAGSNALNLSNDYTSFICGKLEPFWKNVRLRP